MDNDHQRRYIKYNYKRNKPRRVSSPSKKSKESLFERLKDNKIMTKGKYEVEIIITNIESGERVEKRKSRIPEVMKEILENIGRWIEKYDVENFKECHQCGKTRHIEKLSEPDDPDFKDVLFCQKCLEDLMIGKDKLK